MELSQSCAGHLIVLIRDMPRRPEKAVECATALTVD